MELLLHLFYSSESFFVIERFIVSLKDLIAVHKVSSPWVQVLQATHTKVCQEEVSKL